MLCHHHYSSITIAYRWLGAHITHLVRIWLGPNLCGSSRLFSSTAKYGLDYHDTDKGSIVPSEGFYFYVHIPVHPGSALDAVVFVPRFCSERPEAHLSMGSGVEVSSPSNSGETAKRYLCSNFPHIQLLKASDPHNRSDVSHCHGHLRQFR